ncbi:MAG: glycoside hydrolase family 127 protein [Oscillospiraceae bacterium]|nr:glycoside hydrolase family 127 protein [Oscillospiraceae bacterium]
MKQLISILLTLVLVLSLVACADGPADTQPSEPTADPSTPTEPQVDPLDALQVLSLSFEGNVRDASAAANHGTLNKDGSFIEGVSGQALQLDGATYIDLGTSGSLQPAKLTFSAWIKSDGGLAGEHMITWFKPNGRYQGEGWYLSCLDSNTPLKLSVGPSSGQPMEIFVSGSREEFFPAGQWVHIAVTYDSESHTCAIYRNGIAQDVQYINAQSEITADEASHKYIGFNSPGYNGGFAKMAIDELNIFCDALNAAQIIRLYTAFGAEFDSAGIVRSDYDALNLPLSSVKSDITLPTAGVGGSTITWSSSNESALSASGKVTRPAAGENHAYVTLRATITYGDQTMTKDFTICVEAMSSFTDLSDVVMGDVTLLDAYETNAFTLEVSYLKSLDADRLLRGFCDIAGVKSDAKLYGGWETSAIRGHTLGHYLSAVAQAYATCGDAQLKAISDHIVDVLAQCQNPDTGYLAAIPENHYAQIEKGNTAGTWVPWYTMHKVLAGLVDANELTGNEKALAVASRLGDWVYSRTSKWTAATQATVLNVEYGGMNDVLYRLYSHTGSGDHLSAAHSFDEMTLFDSLYKGQDVLNGKHANTTIPKIIGALQRYMVLGQGEEYYLQVAENFWQIVVDNHTYITGGNSEWEHFGQAGILDAERTNCNCETCNTYNMLKLSRELFKITGNQKYADYYESTFINAILSSQNPKTGMTTYFQPMATGFFKVYSSADQHFWCCTGSGMENFSKLGDSIYYQDENSLYVIRYSSSAVRWKGLTVTQNASLPDVTFTVSGSGRGDIVLRVPDWCAGKPTVKINGEGVTAEAVNGFIRLSRDWSDGDVISYSIPMQVVVYNLPDNENVVAFKYGPWVLSANMGQTNMTTSTTGVNVTIPSLDGSLTDVLNIQQGTIADWLKNIDKNLLKTDGKLEFTLKGTDHAWVFTPHYQQHENRYGIYFELRDANTQVGDYESDKYEVIDSLPVANDQYEFSHNLLGEKTGTGMHKGLNYRHAEPGGWFSYDMAVDGSAPNFLRIKLFSGDVGRKFTIEVNGQVLKDVTIENINPDDFYDVYYEIPAELIDGKETVTVTFRADKGSYAGGIFEKLSIVKEKA